MATAAALVLRGGSGSSHRTAAKSARAHLQSNRAYQALNRKRGGARLYGVNDEAEQVGMIQDHDEEGSTAGTAILTAQEGADQQNHSDDDGTQILDDPVEAISAKLDKTKRSSAMHLHASKKTPTSYMALD